MVSFRNRNRDRFLIGLNESISLRTVHTPGYLRPEQLVLLWVCGSQEVSFILPSGYTYNQIPLSRHLDIVPLTLLPKKPVKAAFTSLCL